MAKNEDRNRTSVMKRQRCKCALHLQETREKKQQDDKDVGKCKVSSRYTYQCNEEKMLDTRVLSENIKYQDMLF